MLDGTRFATGVCDRKSSETSTSSSTSARMMPSSRVSHPIACKCCSCAMSRRRGGGARGRCVASGGMRKLERATIGATTIAPSIYIPGHGRSTAGVSVPGEQLLFAATMMMADRYEPLLVAINMHVSQGLMQIEKIEKIRLSRSLQGRAFLSQQRRRRCAPQDVDARGHARRMHRSR